jgi:hypothetical protein
MQSSKQKALKQRVWRGAGSLHHLQGLLASGSVLVIALLENGVIGLRSWPCSFSVSILKMCRICRRLTAYLRACILEIQAISASRLNSV